MAPTSALPLCLPVYYQPLCHHPKTRRVCPVNGGFRLPLLGVIPVCRSCSQGIADPFLAAVSHNRRLSVSGDPGEVMSCSLHLTDEITHIIHTCMAFVNSIFTVFFTLSHLITLYHFKAACMENLYKSVFAFISACDAERHLKHCKHQ